MPRPSSIPLTTKDVCRGCCLFFSLLERGDSGLYKHQIPQNTCLTFHKIKEAKVLPSRHVEKNLQIHSRWFIATPSMRPLVVICGNQEHAQKDWHYFGLSICLLISAIHCCDWKSFLAFTQKKILPIIPLMEAHIPIVGTFSDLGKNGILLFSKDSQCEATETIPLEICMSYCTE